MKLLTPLTRKTQEDRISLQSSKTHASFLPFFAMCLWYKVILSGANARWKKKKPSSEDSLLWWCSHKKSLQFFSFTFPGETNVPYARHCNLSLAYQECYVAPVNKPQQYLSLLQNWDYNTYDSSLISQIQQNIAETVIVKKRIFLPNFQLSFTIR